MINHFRRGRDLPRFGGRVGPHFDLFEACSAYRGRDDHCRPPPGARSIFSLVQRPASKRTLLRGRRVGAIIQLLRHRDPPGEIVREPRQRMPLAFPIPPGYVLANLSGRYSQRIGLRCHNKAASAR
jgi:hypothetical protein